MWVLPFYAIKTLINGISDIVYNHFCYGIQRDNAIEQVCDTVAVCLIGAGELITVIIEAASLHGRAGTVDNGNITGVIFYQIRTAVGIADA